MERTLPTDELAGSPRAKVKTVDFFERPALRDPLQDYWTNVVLWIGLAEALVPFSLLLCGTCYGLATQVPINHSPGDLFFLGIGALALGYTIVFALTLPVAGLAAALVGFFFTSLRLPVSKSVGAASVGGCVGLLISLPTVSREFPSTLLLVVATVLGQIGGAYGARRTYYPNLVANKKRPTIRFGIQQLLILTIWLALAMTGLKLTGMSTASYFVLLGVWLAVQIAGLTAVYSFEHSTIRQPLPQPFHVKRPTSRERQRPDPIDHRF
jgi:uncharacterized membrane protein